jgi:hypothetical protein
MSHSNDLKRAEYLGRMLGTTLWCNMNTKDCTREMLLERLKRISDVANEINDEILHLNKASQ